MLALSNFINRWFEDEGWDMDVDVEPVSVASRDGLLQMGESAVESSIVNVLERAVNDVEEKLSKSIEEFDKKCLEMLKDKQKWEHLLREKLDHVLENARRGISLELLLEVSEVQAEATVFQGRLTLDCEKTHEKLLEIVNVARQDAVSQIAKLAENTAQLKADLLQSVQRELVDKMNEVDIRIQSLVKAEDVMKVRTAEREEATKQLGESLSRNNNALKTEFDSLTDNIKALSAEHATLLSQKSFLSADIARLEPTVTRIREENNNSVVRQAILTGEVNVLELRIEELNKDLSAAQIQLKNTELSQSVLVQNVSHLHGQVASSTTQLREEENNRETMMREKQTLESQIEIVKTNLYTLNNEILLANNTRNQIDNDVSLTSDILTRDTISKESLLNEIEDLKQRKESLTSSLPQLRKFIDIDAEIKVLEKHRSELVSATEKTIVNKENMKAECRVLRGERSLLDENLGLRRCEMTVVETELEKVKSDVTDTENTLKRLKEECSRLSNEIYLHEEDLNDLKGDEDEVQRKTDLLYKKCEDLEKKCEDLEKKCADLEKNSDSLQKKCDELLERRIELEEDSRKVSQIEAEREKRKRNALPTTRRVIWDSTSPELNRETLTPTPAPPGVTPIPEPAPPTFDFSPSLPTPKRTRILSPEGTGEHFKLKFMPAQIITKNVKVGKVTKVMNVKLPTFDAWNQDAVRTWDQGIILKDSAVSRRQLR